MTLPSVSIQKTDFNTGVVRPSDTGVLAIIATAPSGSANVPETSLDTKVSLAEFGNGKLVQAQAYVQSVSGNPVVLCKGTGTTAFSYGAITFTGTGTSVATNGGTAVRDDFDVLIKVIVGGTIGTAGITYTYSLDGGVNESAELALGVATSITIPDTGVSVNLAAGTLIAGDTIAFKAFAPVDTVTDVTNALAALALSSNPFEAVLVDAPATAAMVSAADSWCSSQNARGKFKTVFMTARPRATDGTETEAQYKTALEAIFSATSSINVIVSADVGDVSSIVPGLATTGITQARPVGWCVAARCMKIPIGRDPAYVGDGAVPQFTISDTKGNPKHHDEFKYPGLDDLRLATLRTFDGLQGTFITNAPVISTSGSDYVYVQHVRCINRACEIAYQILLGQLSRGVAKNPKAGPQGQRYIEEGDALRIEGLVNAAIKADLAGQVDDLKFTLSRTDDISSNQGATLHGTIELVALAYIKKFAVTAGFVKSIG